MTPEEILRVEKDIILTLKNVYDPEIPVNIYDLGLIYEIDYDPSGEATIRMTLTAPNCPMADMLVEDVNTQVAKVQGVEKVNVILVFEPAWDKSMMSEEALLELNLLQCASLTLKAQVNDIGIISASLIFEIVGFSGATRVPFIINPVLFC